MAQRIRRLTSNKNLGVRILWSTSFTQRKSDMAAWPKIGGSNPSVVDILFYTKEIFQKGCQYKGQHLATEQATETKLTGHMAAWPNG